jgi:hypothetical protein
MRVFRYDTVQAEDVLVEGASRVKVRWLITKEMGAENFAMCVFEVEPDGYSPLHKHAWEHEVSFWKVRVNFLTEKKQCISGQAMLSLFHQTRYISSRTAAKCF